MATFTQGFDGELRCSHRDLSVCPSCFESTPNLIDVGGVVYFAQPGDKSWAGAKHGTPFITLSPGTVLS